MFDLLLIIAGSFLGIFCSFFVLNDLILYNVEELLKEKGLKARLKRVKKGNSTNV